ncbi:Na+/H+ antiporter NhaC family protein [Bowmanella pacifica]|uniref:Sodium/hydrogen exchanger n=1 Tax=Bowmanella pacifica TaxID=502051 RepID=A0A917YUR5_9ALTE|nr:Na+/H+ antiporter NhaC family protein [Bowmanella pacifica]GGO65290.1 sodium/hydrogen exchanger [Bowmanella pacifica]
MSIEPGIWSILPFVVAISCAFITRAVIMSLVAGIVVGALQLGLTPVKGFSYVFQESLANKEFIWLCIVVVLISLLFELLKKTGVVAEIAYKLSRRLSNKTQATSAAWVMGMAIIDDYFSPLLTGTIMRPVTDKLMISREKLAYIVDATASSVCILVPFTAWGGYIASLLMIDGSPITSIEQGLSVFTHSIFYNYYALLIISFTLLICLNLIPDFGPMKAAELRASIKKQVVNPHTLNAKSMPVDEIESGWTTSTSLLANLAVPLLLVVSVAFVGASVFNQNWVLDALLVAVIYLYISMAVRGQLKSFVEAGTITNKAITLITPTVIMIALAHCLNFISLELGAADYLKAILIDVVSFETLPVFAFLLAGVIAFSTGSSWGTYAVLFPLFLPLVHQLNDQQITDVTYVVVAAIVGGGVFGDHASPVSDTSILASVGAGCEHIDHIVTQLPYALLVATISAVFYAFY